MPGSILCYFVKNNELNIVSDVWLDIGNMLGPPDGQYASCQVTSQGNPTDTVHFYLQDPAPQIDIPTKTIDSITAHVISFYQNNQTNQTWTSWFQMLDSSGNPIGDLFSESINLSIGVPVDYSIHKTLAEIHATGLSDPSMYTDDSGLYYYANDDGPENGICNIDCVAMEYFWDSTKSSRYINSKYYGLRE